MNKKIEKVDALRAKGVQVLTACKRAGISEAYYYAQRRAAGKGRKKKAPAPRRKTEPKHVTLELPSQADTRLLILIGNAVDVVAALERLK
jgi:hypothetical protein